MSEQPMLSVAISLSRKIQPRQYETAEVFLSVSGVTAQTTREEIEALFSGNGKIAWDALKAEVIVRAAAARAEF